MGPITQSVEVNRELTLSTDADGKPVMIEEYVPVPRQLAVVDTPLARMALAALDAKPEQPVPASVNVGGMHLKTVRAIMPKDWKRVYLMSVGKLEKAFCGHDIDIRRQPRTNCEGCWTYFFLHNVEFTQAVGNDIVNDKENELVAKLGTKFVNKAKQFFVLVSKAKEVGQIVEQQEQAEQLQSGGDVTYDVVFKAPTGETGIVHGEIEETA